MKKWFSLVFLVICLATGSICAQYTATWALTSDKTVAVTGVQAANVVALAMVPGSVFSAGTHNTDGFACSYTSSWPTAATDGMYLDFPISPDAASNLTVTGLTFPVKISGSSGSQMFSLAYQVDGAGAWTAIGTPQTATSGGSSTVNFGTISASFENGHTYVIRMYVYAAASGTSSSRKAYVKNVAFSGTVTTASTPAIAVSATSLTSFGTIIAGTSSASQSYTVSGLRLTDNVIVTPPSPFKVSTDNGTFSDSLVLAPSGGVVSSTTVYVKLIAPAAIGTISSSISNHTAGAIAKTVTVNGTVLAVEPTTQSSISFGETTGKSIVVTMAGGNGGKRILVASADNAVSYTPVDGAAENANSNYTAAADKGSGNKVVFAGSDASVTVTGLISGKTYYFSCFEYNEGINNSQNYLTANPGTGSKMTLQVPVLSSNVASVSFGNILFNTISSEKSYTLSGTYLSPSEGVIKISAPAGFDISTTSGSGYDSVASVSYTASTINAVPVYVRFKPTVAAAYSGNITQSGGGADALTVTATGKGVSELPFQAHYDFIVAADGSGDFTTIQAAIDSVPVNNAKWVAILVKKGSYNSHLAISKPYIAIVGESRDSTRIEVDFPRSAWYAQYGTNTGCGVINVATNDSMIIIANMTVINTNASSSQEYTEVFRSETGSTKIWVVNCNMYCQWSDTFSPWGKANGRYYVADCDFRGGIDAVCPRGWAYMINCGFTECKDSSPIWHEGASADLDQKFVIQNGSIHSTKNKAIKLQNAQGSYSKFFYLDCLLSDSVASLGVSSPAYFWNCHRSGTSGDASWFSTNSLSSATGSPSHTDVNAAWVFSGAWDPENEMPPVLQYASLPQPFLKQYDVTASPELKWIGACGATSYNVYFGLTPTPDFVGNQTQTSYSPGTLKSGRTYYWRVDAVNSEGIVTGNTWQFTVAGLVNVDEESTVPTTYALHQNYPNPFNPSTVIKYQVPASGLVVLKVYDVLGKEVATLVNAARAAGAYECTFNAANLPSGLYIYTLKAGNGLLTKKMLLVK
jgi:pectinesterase